MSLVNSCSEPSIGPNKLLANAGELIQLYEQLYGGKLKGRLEVLKLKFKDEMALFSQRNQLAQISQFDQRASKYIFCALFDEALCATNISADALWQQGSLLSDYFNETFGGETVFKIRQYCVENLSAEIDLLELIYICLCFGFKGQYAMQENGQLALDQIKRETYQLICRIKPNVEGSELFETWPNSKPEKNQQPFRLLGITVSICIVVITTIYLSLAINLHEQAVELQHHISHISEKIKTQQKPSVKK